MATQQDIYVAGLGNRPLMFSKDNYIQWLSHLIRYAKSKPNGKLLANSILYGPYKYRTITTPGDPTPPSSRLQPNKELTEAEAKQVGVDDQAIHLLLLGLPVVVYADVDSCENAHAMWLCGPRLMKGTQIRVQEKELILLDELDKFTSIEAESIESYYNRFATLINDSDRNKLSLSIIETNLKFLNHLQHKWAHFATGEADKAFA
ncbi:hypothetical protein Tco_1343855 [Tanacetum coccineum]